MPLQTGCNVGGFFPAPCGETFCQKFGPHRHLDDLEGTEAPRRPVKALTRYIGNDANSLGKLLVNGGRQAIAQAMSAPGEGECASCLCPPEGLFT